MSVQDKISKKFRGIQGGLFEKVSKADVGTALNDLIANGAALMCWADPFYPDPAIPEHVKRATLAGLEDGTSAHYTMPIGNMELKMELAKKLKAFNHLDVDPERNIIITPGSDAGLMFAMMPFIDPGDGARPQLSKQLPERQNPRRCNGAGPPAGGERIPTGDRGVRKTPDAKHQNDCPYQPQQPHHYRYAQRESGEAGPICS